MVDVAHDGDHRRTLLLVLGVFGQFDSLHGFFFVGHGSSGSAEIPGHFGGQF